MSGYYVPKLSRFHQRAPGQVVKPTLVDYYDIGMTRYINENILPQNPSYPTYPKYVPPEQQQQQQFGSGMGSGVLAWLQGRNKLVLAGMAVVAGLVVMTVLKKSGKFKLFGAESFDVNDFEEMDQPYEPKAEGGIVDKVGGAVEDSKKKISNVISLSAPWPDANSTCDCDYFNTINLDLINDSTNYTTNTVADYDFYSATDPVVREQIINDLLAGEKDMKKLINKYNVSKGVVYNIRYDLQVAGKLPYIRKKRKGGVRRGGVKSTPGPAKPTRLPLPPPPPPDEDDTSLPLPPQPPEITVDKEHIDIPEIMPAEEVKVTMNKKAKLPQTDEPNLDNVRASIASGEDREALLAHYGRGVDPVLMDLIWTGKVMETSPGEYTTIDSGGN